MSQNMEYVERRQKGGFRRWATCGFLCIGVFIVVTAGSKASITSDETEPQKPEATLERSGTLLSDLALTTAPTVSQRNGRREGDSHTPGPTDSQEIMRKHSKELDPDEAPSPKAVASEILFLRRSDTPSRRVVLSYSLKGCPSEKLEVGRAAGHSASLQGQEASSRTMNLLRDQVSRLLHAKKLVKKPESVSPRGEEILGYGQDYHVSLRVTVEMESRYLSALQMEVIQTLPEGVTDDEIIQIAKGLPCVEKAYHDSLKFSEQYLRHPVSDGDPDPMNTGTKRRPPQLSKGHSAHYSLDSLGERVTNAFETGDILSNVDADVQVPPNDPSFRLQWNLQDKAEFGLHTERAWQLWTGQRRPMVIAVIDSGCDLDHPDLNAKKWHNPGEICNDGIDNDGNGFTDDCHGWDFATDRPDVRSDSTGHGTGAAGVLGAVPNNLIGLAGVCWGCEIMCLKFIGGGQGTVSNQVQAIDYAVKMGAWISNNSYGGYGHSNLEFDAIRRAQTAGHLFITSAGNHNLNTDLPQNDHTPSSYDLSNILSVGASTHIGRKAAFSNYGLATVHVFAPGADIHTTEGEAGYSKVSGTSFACPHAAGLAGLIWSAFPNLTYLQVKRALIEGCRPSSHLLSLATCGGTLDANKSLYIAAKLSTGSMPDGSTSRTHDYVKSGVDLVGPAALLSGLVRGTSPSLAASPSVLSVRASSRESSINAAIAPPQAHNGGNPTKMPKTDSLQREVNPPFVAPDYRRTIVLGSRSSELDSSSFHSSVANEGSNIFSDGMGPSSTRPPFEAEEEMSTRQPSATSGEVNAFHEETFGTSRVEAIRVADEDSWTEEAPRSFSLFSGQFLPAARTAASFPSFDDFFSAPWSVIPTGEEPQLSAHSESSRMSEKNMSSSNVYLTVKMQESVHDRTTATPTGQAVMNIDEQGSSTTSRRVARTNKSLPALLKDSFSLSLELGKELVTFGNLMAKVPVGNI
ncbi:subtilisin SUB3 [Toxoplasma gondii TgCatPRC2]|uniref:subtilisin n=2 Tax=Toxoplasma gondii TaxID=5811 RepID=A0A151GZQ2_TOXGO|nr:subtilisin SUB3 [Toxoplasma gondii ARI]KYK62600.1 subtilisin SUB3 [Toxoplasma gondii TgCatPRC2]